MKTTKKQTPKKIKSISIKLTFKQAFNVCIASLMYGNEKSKKIALEELMKYASALDKLEAKGIVNPKK